MGKNRKKTLETITNEAIQTLMSYGCMENLTSKQKAEVDEKIKEIRAIAKGVK